MERSLDQWVDYIQTLHYREIELSLERVREVYLRMYPIRMYPAGLPFKIISLSGTNGKGSTAELLASIYHQGGYRVGKFTSPHLICFNERFNLNGKFIDDERLLAAFERVELARRDTPITFFEFGTLLAIDIFATNDVDVAIMEVGLGGRLDSVNILDADVSIITSVSIDHTSWLGNTVEQIAYEKVGIARKGAPLILGLKTPPNTMLTYALELGARLSQIGDDFSYQRDKEANAWEWFNDEFRLSNLPLPYKQAGVQLSNCSLALEALKCLLTELPVDEVTIREGIQNASILGRCQLLQYRPNIVLDVSHNESSVARLSQFLATINKESTISKGAKRRTLAVCGMLKDKEIERSLAQISGRIDEWYTATIHNERGALASDIASVVSSLSDTEIHQYDCVKDAYDKAVNSLTTDDCLVVFGSFHIVGDILEYVS